MDTFTMYTFEARQELAALSAKYDAARSLLALASADDFLFNEEDVWQAQKRVNKLENKIEETTRRLIRAVDQYLDMMGENLGDFLYPREPVA